MSTETKETTNVQEIDVNLESLLGADAGNVMVAAEPGTEVKEKKGMFSPINPDTSFLDKEVIPSTEIKDTPVPGEPVVAPVELTDEEKEKAAADALLADVDVLAPTDPNLNVDLDEKDKGGRPSAMITATKALIEKGLITPFMKDGKEESLDGYTAKDFEELMEANLGHAKSKAENEVPEQFFTSLPPEMQQAYEHMANGGNLKDIFKLLAQSNEVRELDISKESDQKHAIRSYLQATNYGDAEEIEDEIFSLEDRGDLEKKAKQFKPKLDAMQQDIVNQKLLEQEKSAKQRQAQSQNYIESVYTALEKGDLNGLNLDNKMQNKLYAGLVQSNYPSISGKQTNMLGHLLEKYQWVEPNHGLIAEALWLLSDPEGYRGNISSAGENKATEKIERTLKNEEQNKSSSAQIQTTDDNGQRKISKPGLNRPKRNFFDR